MTQFFGKLGNKPISRSFIMGIIQSVDIERHAVSVQPYMMLEELTNVALYRNPGNYSLPSKGDAVCVFFDARGKPMVVGVYPKFIKDTIQTKKDYFLQEGEVLLQTERGGRFMMLNSGIIRLVNWIDQGIEIDESSGSIVLKSHSKKETFAGIVERSGYIRRKSSITTGSTYSFDLDNLESVLRKSGSLDTAGVISATVGTELHEKRIEVKAPGSQTTADPNGKNIFEDTVGHVVDNNSQEVLHTDSSLPLRRKTTYYDSSGITEIMREEIDVKGNVHVYISNQATQGIKVDALIPFIADFLSTKIATTQGMEFTATQSIKINGSTIELNGSSDAVVLASLLVSIFNAHTHTVAGVFLGASSVVSATPLTPITASQIQSTTVKAV